MAEAESSTADIQFEQRGGLGLITLNRPKALNALTLEMIGEMHPRLDAWAADPAVKAVAVQGAGERAFCAGGDILHIYHGREEGRNPFGEAFFRSEYALNRRVKTFPKPYVALMDGVTMGGGVGLSVHGSHRVVSERCLFAMPETGIGLFPDVGGSYFLPRLPGQMGLFLGLTGWRLKAADCLYCGIATVYLESARIDAFIETLASADWVRGPAHALVDEALAGLQGDPGASALADMQPAVDRCFAADSVEAIVTRLEEEPEDWAAKALALIAKASPTSLKLAFRQLRCGADMNFDAAMTMEYRLSQACTAGPDLYEGIRAVVVEKDQAPQWSPASLDAVEPADIERAFAPLGKGDLLFAAEQIDA